MLQRTKQAQRSQSCQRSSPATPVARDAAGSRMQPAAHMCAPAQHNSSQNLIAADWRIALLAGVASRQKAVALQVTEDQAVRAEAMRGFRNHDISGTKIFHPDPFHPQHLAIPDDREHAAAARLKAQLVAAIEQFPAQLLK